MVRRQCDFDSLELIAGLDQDGEFAGRGVRAADAVCDLLGVGRRDAGRMVAVALSVFPTRTLLGEVLEPRLPATAMALGALEIDLAHAEVIESVLNTDAAGRISVQQWVAAEVLFADWARQVNPRQLARHAHDHLEMLDQDGAPPGEDDPQVNELHLSKSRFGVGGRIKGQLDAATFEVVARAIAALVKPAADEDKSLGQRQADALGELCAHALDEGRLPAQGGERPHVSVTMGLDALKAGLRGAHLDFGGRIGPGEVRRLCCDAQVTPIVLGARSEPLDVGREQRCATLPQRRAIAVRDGGCAHPECDRPVRLDSPNTRRAPRIHSPQVGRLLPNASPKASPGRNYPRVGDFVRVSGGFCQRALAHARATAQAQPSRWVGANIRSSAGSTTTLGPGVRRAAARSSPRVSTVVTVAGTPNDLASAAKSGRASSVAVDWPKASVRYSRRMP
jgi:5-methylcytosine-specific restriction protein A